MFFGGSTVTQRIKYIKQPKGGYLPLSKFQEVIFEDGKQLKEENISPSLIGVVVDCLCRYILTDNLTEAFDTCIKGAHNLEFQDEAAKLLSSIDGLNEQSIISACKLSGYNVGYFTLNPNAYKPIEEINADSQTIENIRIMVNRTLTFFNTYGPVIMTGFEFEGAYNSTIVRGIGDYLTEETLWDLKCIKGKPTSNHRLQVLVYYLLGIHSIHPEFKSLKSIGIFNPKKNVAYIFPIAKLTKKLYLDVCKNVIGYTKNEAICQQPINLPVETMYGALAIRKTDINLTPIPNAEFLISTEPNFTAETTTIIKTDNFGYAKMDFYLSADRIYYVVEKNSGIEKVKPNPTVFTLKVLPKTVSTYHVLWNQEYESEWEKSIKFFSEKLDVSRVSSLLKTSPRTVYKLIHNNKIPAIREKNKYFINKSDIPKNQRIDHIIQNALALCHKYQYDFSPFDYYLNEYSFNVQKSESISEIVSKITSGDAFIGVFWVSEMQLKNEATPVLTPNHCINIRINSSQLDPYKRIIFTSFACIVANDEFFLQLINSYRFKLCQAVCYDAPKYLSPSEIMCI